MKSAVLFVVFNRPDTTARVFESIRAAQPPRLYVAADGARAGKAGEAERSAEVRRIATAVDWPCEVRTRFQDSNLGCKVGVSSAIDWFFENEPEGIILEDDVLPQPEFFRYCDDLLEHYRDDATVAMVSGCSFIGNPHGNAASYVFSRYAHVWGWASWRRAWRHYDVAMTGWPSPAARSRLDAVLDGRGDAIDYWSNIFDVTRRGDIDTWDYQWVYACWMNDLVAVMPAGMLVENIGFGADATHTSGGTSRAMRDAPLAYLDFPLRHPVRGSTVEVDRLVERVAFGLTISRRVRDLLKGLPLVGAAARYRSARTSI